MSDDENSNEALDLFLSQLETALEDGHMASNKRAFALIALGLCTLGYGSFSENQRQAIDAARRWLIEGDDRDRAHWRDFVSAGLQAGHALSSADRIIFAALNPVGLDGYGGEFLAYLGEDIGLSPAQIASVFSENIQDFHPEL